MNVAANPKTRALVHTGLYQVRQWQDIGLAARNLEPQWAAEPSSPVCRMGKGAALGRRMIEPRYDTIENANDSVSVEGQCGNREKCP
jgi:hypothetical protein